MLMSISLLFRYADFIKSMGGDEWHLGWVAGLGSVGAILFRIYQGTAIDRFGPMIIWLLSLAGLIVSNLLHVQIENVNGWPLYAARFLMNLCIAGVFGSWLSFVTLRVPANKVAEVLGVVGSSGFAGMALGPVIGDWIFARSLPDWQNVDLMFQISAILLVGSFLTAAMGGFLDWRYRKQNHIPPHKNPNQALGTGLWRLLKKHHPGFLLVVAAMMGLSISIPGTFLRPFAEEQNIDQIKSFFLVYNIVAFVARISFRRAPEILGLRNAILLGLFFMSLSMFSYTLVTSTSTLIFPAIVGGLAHSFLFPSVVAGGTAFFPRENRGLATSLILAMYDFGVLIGSPFVGISVTGSRMFNLPAYPLTFSIVGGLLILIGLMLYGMYARGDGNEMVRKKSLKPSR